MPNANETIETLAHEWGDFKTDHTLRLKAIEEKLARPPIPFQGGFETSPSNSETKEFISWVRSGGTAPRSAKAMDATNANAGSALIPSVIDSQIASVAATYNPIAGLIRRVKAANANFNIPVATGLPAVAWVADTGTRSITATPTMANVQPTSGECYAAAQISAFLAEDATFDVQGWLTQEIGRAVGVGEAAAFTNGNATAKPRGFTTGTINTSPAFGEVGYVPSGSASVITSDGLISLAYGVAAEYRQPGKAAWVMSSSALAAVRSLKASGSGDYLWRVGEGGNPSTLLGYPVYESADLPAVAANAFPVWFGSWDRFYTAVDIATPRLVIDPYTVRGQYVIYYAKRTGGAVVSSDAVKALKISTT